MTTQPHQDEGRDDRTLLALALAVGADRAEVSLTHFSGGRIEVWVSVGVLEMPNGFLAATVILNMLSRFMGAVELRVVGDITPTLETALEAALARLQQIDTREGRSVRRVSVGGEPGDAGRAVDEAAARVGIGDALSFHDGCTAGDAERAISIAFDGWTCALRRGASAGKIVASSVPFGALAAACFAVAEVFKTLVACSVSDEVAAHFRRRFTHDWRFSVWIMEQLNREAPRLAPPPVDPLPPLAIDQVLQVGAGAVGNAAALAFASTAAIRGDLAVLDPKRVDVKNLNRCYYFTETDVGILKVEVLERTATRPGLHVCGWEQGFTAAAAHDGAIIVSTVDNNEVRHRMQEALPGVLVEGATGGTTVAVSVHSPGNGRSCLVCRHPDPAIGGTRHVPLSLAEAAAATGLTEEEIASGRVHGTMAISDDVIARVAARSEDVATILRRAREAGQDLCGALGDLRAELGTISGPREASVPFVSNLAGVLAAAEVVKLLVRADGVADVPVLDNVLEIDLARDYSRHAQIAFLEPPRSDCALCQARGDLVARVMARRG